MMSSRPLSQSSNSSSSSSNNNTNNSRMMMMLVDDSSSSSSSPPSAASAHATLPSPSAPALPPPPEHLCCVHCNYCGTILAVGVPLNSLFKIVTVKCGHCNHLLSVNMGAAALPPELAQAQRQYTEVPKSSPIEREQLSTTLLQEDAQKLLTRVDAPPEKRARLPSVYNRFIKAEIQRIKANNPEIKHKEAFSAAAKNWAHYPHIKFGMMLDKGRQCPEDKESTNAMMNNDGKPQSNFW